jgi:carboxymethylenebutenolidase
MAGQMIEFATEGAPAMGYLALPNAATGPGVVVLHEWWGLTEPFRQACDRLAEAGFVALAPDLYHGKTTASVAEAEAWSAALDADAARWRGDITGALQFLRQHGATDPADGRGAFGFVAFSLGGAYALDMSIALADEIAAVATFYATYPGLDYQGARAAYLCHFAEHDPFVSAESTRVYTYPGTKHWFFDTNRADAYDAAAVALAWDRTVGFLKAELRRS